MWLRARVVGLFGMKKMGALRCLTTSRRVNFLQGALGEWEKNGSSWVQQRHFAFRHVSQRKNNLLLLAWLIYASFRVRVEKWFSSFFEDLESDRLWNFRLVRDERAGSVNRVRIQLTMWNENKNESFRITKRWQTNEKKIILSFRIPFFFFLHEVLKALGDTRKKNSSMFIRLKFILKNNVLLYKWL